MPKDLDFLRWLLSDLGERKSYPSSERHQGSFKYLVEAPNWSIEAEGYRESSLQAGVTRGSFLEEKPFELLLLRRLDSDSG